MKATWLQASEKFKLSIFLKDIVAPHLHFKGEDYKGQKVKFSQILNIITPYETGKCLIEYRIIHIKEKIKKFDSRRTASNTNLLYLHIIMADSVVKLMFWRRKNYVDS